MAGRDTDVGSLDRSSFVLEGDFVPAAWEFEVEGLFFV